MSTKKLYALTDSEAMDPYYQDEQVTFHHGDARDVLASLPDNSVDAVVTDPPYGLANTTPAQVAETLSRWTTGDRNYTPAGRGFMGQEWDAFVPPPAVWDECYRVLKPGGHLAVFAGSRTQDLMGLSVRLAGFDVRDSLAWLYGSGFPKSLDVSKAIDKTNGEAGRLHKFTAWMRTTGLTSRQLNEVTRTSMGGHYLTAASQPAIPTPDLWAKIRPLAGDVPSWVDELVERIEAEREVIRIRAGAQSESTGRYGAWGNDDGTGRSEFAETSAATEAAKRWQGWGTALKPAHEPILLARKPLEGTVAANVTTWGTGAINIDATRIPSTDSQLAEKYASVQNAGARENSVYGKDARDRAGAEPHAAGRWPANVVLDEYAAHELDQQSGSVGANGDNGQKAKNKFRGVYGDNFQSAPEAPLPRDKGGASRFFKVVEPDPPFMYAAKAPKRERPNIDGVQHPTVKPLALMRWLVRLLTPPGGVVLDPFAGSGTTLLAAVDEDHHVIGVELEERYCEIIASRLAQGALDPGI